MVDNDIRARAPTGTLYSNNNNSPQSPQALAKNFEKLTNKPEIVSQVSKDAAVVVTSTGTGASKSGGDSSGIKSALKSTKEAAESVRNLREPNSGGLFGEPRIPPVGVEELAKDLEALKESIHELFAQLRSKSDSVAVADANAEAAQSQTKTLDRVLYKAEETGLHIQFKPKSAMSAHSDRISTVAVEKLLSEDRGNI